MFITIIVLAPVGEEILFRGVLLNVFRTTHAWTMWVGVVIIALLFTSFHSQYQNLSTLAEMMALSAIFAWARIRSGGLLLPILLHSFASILGTVFSII
ncbi:CPBP family intramembrane glutamic endopeptidase [Pantoea ananatis]|uniref:CPBP family intramembrane glutamic endopeptidase n=1 Tax=Pantoea ananas TaxID=553 RepID=UPI00215AF388|nr:CPBP family intramembrane glutamic endopeptidase [Pantoea ananatis]